MSKYHTKILIIEFFILFILISICSGATAQNSINTTTDDQAMNRKIKGYVTDEAGQPIIGANIMILGTPDGTITDVNGMFVIDATSKSTLKISYIGYDVKEIVIGNVSALKIQLQPSLRMLSEVVVNAQAIGQKNAIRSQINSNTIKNVVAADRLQENPDANAAEALGRLPGISLNRSGGEGTSLQIRGLQPRYTAITLNGVELPSTSGTDRTTNLSGISQYALQGAEVFKSLTADMEANSVAGTVNLKLREAPKGLHYDIMSQMGYNDLNNYWGNYKFLGEFSNRLFDNKLGLLLTASAERVNRSIQTMSGSYGIEGSDPINSPILINSVSLNNINRIIYRRSAMLSLDYKLSESTTLALYGMFNNQHNDEKTLSKTFGTTGKGDVSFNYSTNPNNQTNIFQTALSGNTNLDFLHIKFEYGVAYSGGYSYFDNARNWSFNFPAYNDISISDLDRRTNWYPSQFVPLFNDKSTDLSQSFLTNFGTTSSKTKDQNINTYLNLTIPFQIGEKIKGNIKLGGMYKNKVRTRDDIAGSQNNTYTGGSVPTILKDSLNWLNLGIYGISAEGLGAGSINSFLNGQYQFGNILDFNKLNQISDAWERFSNYHLALGTYPPVVIDQSKIGYTQNGFASTMNDQNINENYYSGYLMTDINWGKHIMFLPGVRMENTDAVLKGYNTRPTSTPIPMGEPLAGVYDTTAYRADRYILPMIHLRIKPTDKFYMHFAYTQTLSRPDYNQLMPNYFKNTGFPPMVYVGGNPQLKPELWTNLDAQLVYHANKFGIFSVNVFNKTVKNKLVSRVYTRIQGDPILSGFPDDATVSVQITENSNYVGLLQGVELDWQTSFTYLPNFLKYFTVSANYTYTYSKSEYPFSSAPEYIYDPDTGMPIKEIRKDTVLSGPMINQPKHIVNASIGLCKNGFNIWLSYQYNGQINIYQNQYGTTRTDVKKNDFQRWDLQLTKKFSIGKLDAIEAMLNIANMNNYTETKQYRGDIRPLYQENYGWTTDLGLRYRF